MVGSLAAKEASPICVILSIGLESSTVDVLIDPRRRQWNLEMIDGLFNAEEAKLIKTILLSREAKEDVLFWPHSSDGRYSCKTGYRFLKMEEELNNEPQVTTNDHTQVWKTVRSMRAPSKVKTLLWRACREAMPTKSALFRRTISTDPHCVRCHASSENSLHALWSCPELDPVWSDLQLWSVRGAVQFMDFKEILSWLIQNNHHLDLFAVTFWQIWNQRNQVRLNQPANSLHQIVHISKVWLADYHARQVSSDVPVQQNQRPRKHWKPPSSEFFKINFDNAVFPHEKKAGIGVVIRDHNGLVIASCTKSVHQELCSDDIEAIAGGWALAFALEIGVKRAVLEGDSWMLSKV